MQKFAYKITSAVARRGPIVKLDKWAKDAQIPDNKNPGGYLSGERITEILGIESKAWAPEWTLKDVVTEAKRALQTQDIDPASIDNVIVSTSTPYHPALDMDAFYLMKELNLRSDILPVQATAGCAGLTRSVNLAYQMQAKRVLFLTYSMIAHETFQNGKLKEKYRDGHAWMTSALFSDGIGVMVMEKDTTEKGISFHAREVNEPSRLIELGEEKEFLMDGPAIKEYYAKGMTKNDHELEKLCPSYKEEMGESAID